MKRHLIRLVSTSAFLSAVVTAHLGFAQSIPRQDSGSFAEINGMRMYFQIHGTGKPLLLLHWYDGTGSHSWGPFIKELSAKYKLIIPDLRGHGQTVNPVDSFSIQQCAEDVSLLLDHLNLKQCDAMGASLGGMTLLHLATRDPDRVSSMVLIGSGIYFTEPARQFMRDEVAEFYLDRPKYLEHMKTIHPGGDEQIQKLCRLFSKLADKYDDVNFTSPYLGKITAKTMIVSGDDDPYFPPKMQLEMYSAIPKSSLWIIPDGGHLPHLKMVDEFTRRSLRFLENR